MRARNKLNVKQVAALARVGVHSDGGGLYLRVRACGSKSWVFIFTFGGKRREMGLGSALDITLAKARERAAAARELVIDGIDPQKQRKSARAVLPEKPPVTFGEFTRDWLDQVEDGFNNPKHRQQWRNTLASHAGSLSAFPISDIATEHVLDVLKPIWLTKSETASRVRQRIERVLDAARVKGLRSGENPAGWRGHLEMLLPRQSGAVKHHAALPYAELPAFMAALGKLAGVAAQALQFTILTAARSGETRGLTWGEIDLETKLWTVPASRMKARVVHEVPLCERALELLASARQPATNPDHLVFPAPRGGPMSDMTMAAVLKRMERKDITVHGFRSTFRDWAGDCTSFAREEVEMALAHTVASGVERAYRRGRALEKRRELMAAWCSYCCSSKAPQ